MCLARGHNAVTPVRLESAALRSQVKHSITEQLRSPYAAATTCKLYSKTCLKRPLKRRRKLGFKTDYRLMQVKSIAGCLWNLGQWFRRRCRLKDYSSGALAALLFIGAEPLKQF